MTDHADTSSFANAEPQSPVSFRVGDGSMDDQQTRLAAIRTIDLLGLADVPRWGVIKILRPQSVAEHSFAVAVLVMELITRLSPYSLTAPASLGAVIWALCHDAPETYTGDVDGLLKREHPTLKAELDKAEGEAFPWWAEMRRGMEATPGLMALVKVADRVEAIVYLRQWGIGTRADDVKRELTRILWESDVPRLTSILGDKGEIVIGEVDQILNHSTSEAGSYQFRRTLRIEPDPGPESDPALVTPPPDPPQAKE